MTKKNDRGGKRLAAYEPDPVPNDSVSMHDLVIIDIQNYSIEIEEGHKNAFSDVVEDLKDRRQFGLDKYGTLLQAGNGRNALLDAYQEVQDMLVYLKQAIVENNNKKNYVGYELLNIYSRTIQSAIRLRQLLNVVK
jgi:hypothetical protein